MTTAHAWTTSDYTAAEWLTMIEHEMDEAREHYPAFHSSHEAYGVLAEEVAEFFDAIRDNDELGARGEAVQVAAVALRFLIDRPPMASGQ